MKARRASAVAIALIGAAFAAAGCGLGAGEQVGEAELTVTQDFGARALVDPRREEVAESDTVMRVLDRNVEISTRFGGGFVSSIEGVSEAARDGRRYDWFFYVNGVDSPVGAADYPLHGGEAIWWDYRDWSDALRVPAVVGSWPQPFLDGYEGQRHPVFVECHGEPGPCQAVRLHLEEAGASLDRRPSEEAIVVLVGPWRRVRSDPAARQLEAGPQVSGVYADFERRGARFQMWGLNPEGEAARPFGPGAGLIAATRRYDNPPVWMVTGVGADGVRAAASSLRMDSLRDHYAVAVDAGDVVPLPVP